MMFLYASLDELKGRLGWEPDAAELGIAAGALDDVSGLAAVYGRGWPDTTATSLMTTLVRKSASRAGR